MISKKLFCGAAVAVALLSSCVTQQKYDEVSRLQAYYYDEARLCNEENEENERLIGELEDSLRVLTLQNSQMQQDTVRLVEELNRVQADCGLMQKQNEDLIVKLKNSKTAEEAAAMMQEIQTLQNELIKREDALFKAERKLTEKQNELDVQNAKVKELTAVLDSSSNRMAALKNTIKDALTNYETDGLKVDYRNGRVYVSVSEQLLFKTGRWDVDAKGAEAIRSLSEILAKHPDIDITVEGHTDNHAYNGSGQITDNWDLSCKRATAIIRILLENKDMDPARVSAAGRAEYCPVDSSDNALARKKNRRSEIILTPNMERVMKLLD